MMGRSFTYLAALVISTLQLGFPAANGFVAPYCAFTLFYNRPYYLIRTLRAFVGYMNAIEPDLPYRIAVFDNGSTKENHDIFMRGIKPLGQVGQTQCLACEDPAFIEHEHVAMVPRESKSRLEPVSLYLRCTTGHAVLLTAVRWMAPFQH